MHRHNNKKIKQHLKTIIHRLVGTTSFRYNNSESKFLNEFLNSIILNSLFLNSIILNSIILNSLILNSII